MQNFNYVAKDSTGALKRGRLQTADRGAALAALKANGLVPVSLKEGQSQDAVERPSWFSTRHLSLLAGSLGLLLLIVVAAYFVKPRGGAGDTKPISAQEPELPPKHATAVKHTPLSTVDSLPTEKSNFSEVNTASNHEKMGGKTSGNHLEIVQNENAFANSNAVPAVEPVRRPFTTGTDQIIAMYANVALGYPPPPLMNLPLSEDIAKVLDQDIILYDDDDEHVAHSKENVAYMKQELKKYLANGGAPETFLEFYHKSLTDCYNEWKESQHYVIDLLRAGDMDAAKKYAEDINAKFQERGMRPVVLPPNLVNRL